jgi:hypothetical protein
MTNGHPIPFIGVRIHHNRTPFGRRSSTPARRAAHYYAYGRGAALESGSRQRGIWYGPDGQSHSHEQVLAWARREALGHRYTFEALLSVQQGRLTAEAFTSAMQQGEAITDWRLLVHRDTDYRHAHVLFFRDHRLEKGEFLAWQEQVREALLQLEKEHTVEQQLQYEAAAGKARGLEVEAR